MTSPEKMGESQLFNEDSPKKNDPPAAPQQLEPDGQKPSYI